jgi:hypothetical protein
MFTSIVGGLSAYNIIFVMKSYLIKPHHASIKYEKKKIFKMKITPIKNLMSVLINFTGVKDVSKCKFDWR